MSINSQWGPLPPRAPPRPTRSPPPKSHPRPIICISRIQSQTFTKRSFHCLFNSLIVSSYLPSPGLPPPPKFHSPIRGFKFHLPCPEFHVSPNCGLQIPTSHSSFCLYILNPTSHLNVTFHLLANFSFKSPPQKMSSLATWPRPCLPPRRHPCASN